MLESAPPRVIYTGFHLESNMGACHYISVIFSPSQDLSYDLPQLDGYVKDASVEGSRQTIVNSGLHVPIQLNLRFSWL